MQKVLAQLSGLVLNIQPVLEEFIHPSQKENKDFWDLQLWKVFLHPNRKDANGIKKYLLDLGELNLLSRGPILLIGQLYGDQLQNF